MTEFWRRIVALPRFLITAMGCTTHFCTPCDNPTSGPAVRYLNVSILLWKCEPSVVIGNLDMSSIFVSFTTHFIRNDIENFLACKNLLIWKVLCDGRMLFGPTILWRLCGFRHSEKSMKSGLAVCKTLINYFLDKVALKGTRQRFKCFLWWRIYTAHLEKGSWWAWMWSV